MKHLIVLLLLFFIGSVSAQNLQINEFMASNDTAYPDENGEFDDWIEIYNPGPTPVDIGGWYITDDLTAPDTWQIPATQPDSTTVPARGFLILWADKQPEQGVLHVNIKLSGSGEQIGLYNASMEVVDTLTYGDQTTDVSKGRLPDGSDTWELFTNSTPMFTNAMMPIIINEFMADNESYLDEFGDPGDWIELFNVGVQPIDIGGWYITDDLTAPDTWQIPDTAPDTTTIQPREYLILWADKESEKGVLHLEIKLSSGGEQIGLYLPDLTVVDSLTFGPQQVDTSLGRLTDGTNIWALFSPATPGDSNEGGTVITGIEDNYDVVVSDYTLEQNYPNPFNPTTTIRFTIPENGLVTLKVFNLLGEEVAELINSDMTAGAYNYNFDASNLTSGIYFYSLQAGNFSVTKKMILMK